MLGVASPSQKDYPYSLSNLPIPSCWIFLSLPPIFLSFDLEICILLEMFWRSELPCEPINVGGSIFSRSNIKILIPIKNPKTIQCVIDNVIHSPWFENKFLDIDNLETEIRFLI